MARLFAIAAAISRPVTPRAKVRVVWSGNVITIEACYAGGQRGGSLEIHGTGAWDGEQVAGTAAEAARRDAPLDQDVALSSKG